MEFVNLGIRRNGDHRCHPRALEHRIAPSLSVPWVTSKRPKSCVASSSALSGVWYGTFAIEDACGKPDSLPPGLLGMQLSLCDAGLVCG